MVYNVCLQTKIEKLYISEIDRFHTTPHKCYMGIYKQLIKLVYNDVKNLT